MIVIQSDLQDALDLSDGVLYSLVAGELELAVLISPCSRMRIGRTGNERNVLWTVGEEWVTLHFGTAKDADVRRIQPSELNDMDMSQIERCLYLRYRICPVALLLELLI